MSLSFFLIAFLIIANAYLCYRIGLLKVKNTRQAQSIVSLMETTKALENMPFTVTHLLNDSQNNSMYDARLTVEHKIYREQFSISGKHQQYLPDFLKKRVLVDSVIVCLEHFKEAIERDFENEVKAVQQSSTNGSI